MITNLHRGGRSFSGHPMIRGPIMRVVYLDESGTSTREELQAVVVAGMIVNTDLQYDKVAEHLADLRDK